MPLALWGATLCVSLGALIILLGIAIFREDTRQRSNRWAALMLSFGGLGALHQALEKRLDQLQVPIHRGLLLLERLNLALQRCDLVGLVLGRREREHRDDADTGKSSKQHEWLILSERGSRGTSCRD